MASLRPASHALVIGLLTASTAFAQAPPLAWEAFVDGNLPGIDEARGLVVAPDNSIYVTGSSANIAPQGTITTVRYAPNGTQLWIDHPYGPSQSAENKGVALAIAPDGHVYVGGTLANNNGDFALIKYNASGRLWKKNYEQYDQADVPDEGAALAVDDQGDVYLAGYITSTSGMGYDQYVMKTDSSGERLWGNDFAVSSADEHATCMAISPNGNIYVGGDWWNLNGNGAIDLSVARFGADGTRLWDKSYEAPGMNDRAIGIATTDAGGVIVCGTVQGAIDMDMAVVARDAAGTELWSAVYDGSGPGNDEALAVRELANGQVVVVGHSLELINGQLRHTIATRLYDAGSLLWEAAYPGPEGLGAWPTSVTLDHENDLLIAGYSTAPGGLTTDGLIVKYDMTGSLAWAIPYAGAAGFNDRFNAIGVNTAGDVIVCGTTHSAANASKYITVQYGNAVGMKEDPAGKGGPIVFPNPVSSRLSIRHIDPETSIGVFNALGERVYATRSPQGIDVGHWNEGVYFVRTDNGSAVHTTRFTVQH